MCASSCRDLVHEPRVQPQIAGELGMEARDPGRPLAREHGMAGVRGHDFDGVTRGLDPRRADEHAAEATARERRAVEIDFYRVALAPVGVAPYRDVDDTEGLLIRPTVHYLACEQDHPCTGAERGHAVTKAVGEGPAELGGVEQLAHRGGLATGKDECVECAEVF